MIREQNGEYERFFVIISDKIIQITFITSSDLFVDNDNGVILTE